MRLILPTPKPWQFDPKRYEGCTPNEWEWNEVPLPGIGPGEIAWVLDEIQESVSMDGPIQERVGCVLRHHAPWVPRPADRALIADAPLLLAELIREREKVAKLEADLRQGALDRSAMTVEIERLRAALEAALYDHCGGRWPDVPCDPNPMHCPEWHGLARAALKGTP
jgi:hypothetical protein